MGDPVELDLIPTQWVEPLIGQDGSLSYRISRGVDKFIARPRDMVHIKGLCPDGLIGYSILDILAEPLSENLATQRYTSQFFQNGAHPGLVIELDEFLKDENKVKVFKAGLSEAYAGMMNAHKIMLLQKGKLADNKTSHEALQLVGLREFGLLTAANILGLPPHKVGMNISSSYSSIEQENKAFLTDSLEPWLCQLERELRSKLCYEREKQWDTCFVQFDRSNYLSGDPAKKTEAETAAIYLASKVITPEEQRAWLNLPPFTDEQKAELKPPAPVLPPQAEDKPEDKPDTEQKPDAERALLVATTKRLNLRLVKSQKNATGDALQDWAELELPTHRDIIRDNLLPVLKVCKPNEDAENLVDTFYRSVEANAGDSTQWKI